MEQPKDYDDEPPQGDLFNFGFTQCEQCGCLLTEKEAAKHTFYDDKGQQELHFCRDLIQPEDSCRNKWYMHRLRKEGL